MKQEVKSKNTRRKAQKVQLSHLPNESVEVKKECDLRRSNGHVLMNNLVAAGKQGIMEKLASVDGRGKEADKMECRHEEVTQQSILVDWKKETKTEIHQKEALGNNCSGKKTNKIDILKASCFKRKRVDFVYPAAEGSHFKKSCRQNQTSHRFFFPPKAWETENITSNSDAVTHTRSEKETCFLPNIENTYCETIQKCKLNDEGSSQLINKWEKERNEKVLAKEACPSKQPIERCPEKLTHSKTQISASHWKRQEQLQTETRCLQLSYGETSVNDAVLDKKGNRPRSNSTDVELNLPQRGLCEERAVLATHTWRSQLQPTHGWVLTELSQSRAPPGMQNLGNTCFLNATLQCLAYLPTFCQCITSLSLSSSSKIGSNGQKIIFMMRSLMRKIHSLDTEDGKVSSTISPKGIVRALPTLGGGSKRRFQLGRQEDAHEFLVHLLDAMKDGELIEAGINPCISGWRDRLPIARLDETTLIHRMFGGYFRSQVRCTNCEYKSNTYDPFLDLSLEVSQGNINSLSSAIGYFTRKEKLDVLNQWKCGGCKKHVCATKQFTIFRPPLTLCVQLKRFAFSGGLSHSFGSSGNSGQKICKRIQFPASLSLPLSDKRQCEYTLTGVIVHVGGSSKSGHYMAYVKKLVCEDRMTRALTYQWYFLDDSSVHAVSENKVLQQNNAYVLFYCRKEVKLEFPTPPSKSNMSAAEASVSGKVRARARADSFASICSHVPTPSASLNKRSETVVVNVRDKDSSVLPILDEPFLNVSGSDSSKRFFLINYSCQASNMRTRTGKDANAMQQCTKSSYSSTRSEIFGNEAFEKWSGANSANEGTSERDNQRNCVALSEQAREKERQQSMRLSNWDAALDEGKKKKKTKLKDGYENLSLEQNPFHKVQSKKLQMMGNGQVKGKQKRFVSNYRQGCFTKRNRGHKGSKKWKR